MRPVHLLGLHLGIQTNKSLQTKACKQATPAPYLLLNGINNCIPVFFLSSSLSRFFSGTALRDIAATYTIRCAFSTASRLHVYDCTTMPLYERLMVLGIIDSNDDGVDVKTQMKPIAGTRTRTARARDDGAATVGDDKAVRAAFKRSQKKKVRTADCLAARAPAVFVRKH